MKFLIVDAFTETLFGGNPAGVVLLPDGQDFPSDEVMVKTAAELRYSETAFIRQLGPKEFQVRYFTPAAEVDLCGHATIGSFCALEHLGIISAGDTVMNHTLAGDLIIDVGTGFVMMDMAAPTDMGTIDDPKALEELYSIMGAVWDKDRIGMLPKMISTGLPDIMMPLATKEDLNAMEPDMKALAELSKRYEVVGVHAFTLDADEGVTAHARNFAPLYDIDEEAATGTSSGAMTYYFYLNNVIGDRATCRFLQGEKMDRPSVILSELVASDYGDPASASDDPTSTPVEPASPSEGQAAGKQVTIKVGGSAVVLAEGEINL